MRADLGPPPPCGEVEITTSRQRRSDFGRGPWAFPRLPPPEICSPRNECGVANFDLPARGRWFQIVRLHRTLAMTTEIVVPAEQEGTKAVLKTWLKKRGDAVRLDEPIVEIETDKVAVEIAATANGVLSEILIEEGADVSPGSVLGRITEGAAVKESQR